MRRKDGSIAELERATEMMVQGSLSETTRQCGDPSCACATDRARRHGPHLYLRFTTDGKAQSVYVPPEHDETVKEAHRAWLRFQEIAVAIAAENRERLLRVVQRAKQAAKKRRSASGSQA